MVSLASTVSASSSGSSRSSRTAPPRLIRQQLVAAYTDRDTLTAWLDNRFGPKTYTIKIRCGNFEVCTPEKITKEEKIAIRNAMHYVNGFDSTDGQYS